jgi:hypothetical protein
VIKKSNYFQGLLDAAFINDSLFVRNDLYLSPELQLLTFKDELPRKTWRYGDPAIMNRFADPNFGIVYANESRIVYCYRYKKQIDFMDTDFNCIKKVKYPPINPARGDISEAKVGDFSNYLGKRYLYALFMGAEWNVCGKDLSFGGSTLEVFDLDGNPVIKYRFDGLTPSFFVIDEETFTLYGCREDGEPLDHLLVYKLKWLL